MWRIEQLYNNFTPNWLTDEPLWICKKRTRQTLECTQVVTNEVLNVYKRSFEGALPEVLVGLRSRSNTITVMNWLTKLNCCKVRLKLVLQSCRGLPGHCNVNGSNMCGPSYSSIAWHEQADDRLCQDIRTEERVNSNPCATLASPWDWFCLCLAFVEHDSFPTEAGGASNRGASTLKNAIALFRDPLRNDVACSKSDFHPQPLMCPGRVLGTCLCLSLIKNDDWFRQMLAIEHLLQKCFRLLNFREEVPFLETFDRIWTWKLLKPPHLKDRRIDRMTECWVLVGPNMRMLSNCVISIWSRTSDHDVALSICDS